MRREKPFNRPHEAQAQAGKEAEAIKTAIIQARQSKY